MERIVASEVVLYYWAAPTIRMQQKGAETLDLVRQSTICGQRWLMLDSSLRTVWEYLRVDDWERRQNDKPFSERFKSYDELCRWISDFGIVVVQDSHRLRKKLLDDVRESEAQYAASRQLPILPLFSQAFERDVLQNLGLSAEVLTLQDLKQLVDSPIDVGQSVDVDQLG